MELSIFNKKLEVLQNTMIQNASEENGDEKRYICNKLLSSH